MNGIQVDDLNYGALFSDFHFEVKKGTFLSLIGRNGCGKSILVKIILGLIPVEGKILIDGFQLNSKNKRQIRKKIGIVFENPNHNFVSETAREEFTTFLRNIGCSEAKIKKQIDAIIEQIPIQDLLDCSISSLSGGQKQLIALALATIHNPSILILDDAFSMLDGVTKEKMLKWLKKLNREQKVTILQITNDMEDTLYGNEVAIMDDGTIILQGKKQDVFKEEKLVQQTGLELPFMASLSLKLKFYDLVDDVILDLDKMVNVLWK